MSRSLFLMSPLGILSFCLYVWYNSNVLGFALSYFVLLLSLRSMFVFLKRDRKEVDLDRRGGEEEWEKKRERKPNSGYIM